MDKNELVVIKENCPVLSEKVESYIDEVYHQADEASKLTETMRSTLLEAMVENDIFSCKVGKYTISQVLGRDTVIFDTDKFLEEANENIVLAFTKLEPKTPVFNLEKFKQDHPDLYEAYLDKDDNIVVDTKKLEKTMPAVYEKFVTVIKSEKKPTIMIKTAKEK